MTVGKWDAEAWHRRHRREPPTPGNKKPWVYVAVAAFILTAAGVSATQAFDGPEKIGVCHHTGDGFVFLAVADDGFEHGHHRHHVNDYFVPAGQAGCGAVPAPEVPEETEVNTTAPVDNATVEAPVETPGQGNTTEAVDETAPETPANETAPEPIHPGDVAIVQTADQDDKKVRLMLTVTNIGQGNASDVSLSDDLPDLRRAWSLSGVDAKSCVLNGQALRCWFGDLAPGESAQIQLSAYTDRMPCGDAMTNTATVGAKDDAEARNNASSASIMARYC